MSSMKSILKVSCSILSAILFIIFLLSGQFKKIILFLIISFIHEIGHLIACILLKVKVKKIKILPFGFQMDIENIENLKLYKQIIIYLSGPLTFIMNLIIFNSISIIGSYSKAILLRANYLVAFFNLLPIYPLDGYHILNAIINYFVPCKKAIKISMIASILFFMAFLIYNFFSPQLFLLLFLVFEQFKNIQYSKKIYRDFLIYKTSKEKHKRKKIINNYLMYKDSNHLKIENNKILTDYQIALHELKEN